MDMLDRMVDHDAWATRELLTRCATLPDTSLDRRFDGQWTLRETFVHIVAVMESWTRRMQGRPWDGAWSRAEPLPSLGEIGQRFERIATDVRELAHQVRAAEQLDALFVDTRSDPLRGKTYGAGLLHVTTHGMNHRAQVFALLDRLGFDYGGFEGDALDWEQQTRPGGLWPLVTLPAAPADYVHASEADAAA